MDKIGKISFIRNLTTSVADELATKVLSGAIPEDWDGHELRQLLADKFAREVSWEFKDKRTRNGRRYARETAEFNL